MYRFLLVAVLFVIAMAHPKEHCGHLIHGGRKCCNKEMVRPPPPGDDWKECLDKLKPPPPPPSCEVDICIAKKRGVASDDGTIDKQALSDMVEQDFESEPHLIDNMKKNCINGDVSKFGMPDMCDLMKMEFCFHLQMIKECDSWNDDGECKGMGDLATECIQKYS